MNDFLITLDVDWAPDFVLEHVAEVLTPAGVKATWFVTHDSPAVQRIMKDPLFEAGIHPNFLPGSSHGDTPDKVLDYMLSIVPGARSTRSHAVVQSGPLLNLLSNRGLALDSTIFLPEMPEIRPVTHLGLHSTLLRVPFFWADDYEMCKATPAWDLERYKKTPGLKVMMFHPIHIWLNSVSFQDYQNFKTAFPSVSSASSADAWRFRNSGKGTFNFFVDLVDHLKGGPSKKMCDLLA